MKSVLGSVRPQGVWAALVRAHPARALLIALALLVTLAAVWVLLFHETAFGRGHVLRALARVVLSFLVSQEFVSLFLTVAGGYALAKVEFKGVSLGTTASTMVLGIALSAWASAGYGLNFSLASSTGTLFL